jgi:integrase
MKRPHPFRLVRRTVGNKKAYYVTYDHDPGHPKSTRSQDFDEAVAWAYEHLDDFEPRSTVLFGDFAKHFYLPDKCSWSQRKMRHGSHFGASYFSQRRGMLENHILPELGNMPLSAITPAMLEDVLLSMRHLKTGEALAPHTLERMRVILRTVFDEAVFQGILSKNPAQSIPAFYGTRDPRQPFTLEEIHKFFPEDFDRALRIWGSLDWYGYFLMQWHTGARPQEVMAFRLRDWNKRLHGAVLENAVEAKTRRVKGLKTDSSGTKAKAVVFGPELENLLTMLEFSGREVSEPAFQVNGRAMEHNAANKHLRAASQRAGVEIGDRTQYSFRHSFYTELLRILPKEAVQQMAGHRSLRKEYDHRVAEDFLKDAQPMREVIERMRSDFSEPIKRRGIDDD